MVELATGYQRLAEVMFNGYGLSNVGDRKGADSALKLFDQSIVDSQQALALRADGDAQFQLARANVSAAQAALSGKLSGREYLNKARAEYAR